MVHVYLARAEADVLVCRLWFRSSKGRASASFEYDRGWLASPDRFALEPALTLSPGAHHTADGKALFGALGDSAPDRWGRGLMRRAERRRTLKEARPPHTLSEMDFLLLVDDQVRQGALRFREGPEGPFLAVPSGGSRIPPLVDLPRLLAATAKVARDVDSEDDLRLLLAPGASLGGARPKAAVRDTDGVRSIAKFPHPDDEHPVGPWEATALELARQAQIRTPGFRLVRVLDRDVLLVRRFDRAEPRVTDRERRIPFLSAMSMLGASDGETRSYLEIADAIRMHGAAPAADLRELWRRIVFGVLISNVDDHLRNHGFLHTGTEGWRLAPVYDINPVPTDVRPRILATAIDEADTTASLELALGVAEYFDIKPDDARVIAGEVGKVVARWREEAAKKGLKPSDINRMESAFEHDDLRSALAMAGPQKRARGRSSAPPEEPRDAADDAAGISFKP
jgi:serine/threonine-protein kinase HipA